MKVYELKYTGVSMGFLIVPQSYVEDERTQRWFKEFDLPPVEAVELDPSKVSLGTKSLLEIEQESLNGLTE
jgi:hypothetical protein